MTTTQLPLYIEVRGVRFAYEASGDPARPLLVLTHSLLWDRDMFRDVATALSTDYRVLSIDLHGHGDTGCSPLGEKLTLAQMTDDCAALLEALDLGGPVHWVGLSMGGMVGMRLAVRHPGKLRSLVLMDTSAQPEDPARRAQYMQLAAVLRNGKAAAVADLVLPFYFCPTTYAEQPELIDRYRQKLGNVPSAEGIYQAALAVFDRPDFSEHLSEISCPTLVLVGSDDISTTLSRSEHLVRHIRGATLQVIPQAGHMSATEKPAEVTTAITNFLKNVP
jgi:3-oxoadipate enol-lactonase